MDSKVCLVLFFTAVLITISRAAPTVSKDFCDSFNKKDYGSVKGDVGTITTRKESINDSDVAKKLVKRAEDVLERGNDPYLDSNGDVTIKTLLNQCARSQGSIIRTLAEDNSMLTTSTSMVRQQSNDSIKKSELKAMDVVIYAPITTGK